MLGCMADSCQSWSWRWTRTEGPAVTPTGCCTLWKHSSGRSSCGQMQEMGEETERMFCYFPFVSPYNTRVRACVCAWVCVLSVLSCTCHTQTLFVSFSIKETQHNHSMSTAHGHKETHYLGRAEQLEPCRRFSNTSEACRVGAAGAAQTQPIQPFRQSTTTLHFLWKRATNMQGWGEIPHLNGPSRQELAVASMWVIMMSHVFNKSCVTENISHTVSVPNISSLCLIKQADTPSHNESIMRICRVSFRGLLKDRKNRVTW